MEPGIIAKMPASVKESCITIYHMIIKFSTRKVSPSEMRTILLLLNAIKKKDFTCIPFIFKSLDCSRLEL